MQLFVKLFCTIAFLLPFTPLRIYPNPGPFDGTYFKGRIAFSSDGNFNDEDDWGAFPIAIAMLDVFHVKEKLVHVDYNNILPQNDPRFYKEMTTSVLGAADRYGIPRSILFDCQNDLDGAIESIKTAINASSAHNPLYYILAGPMDVPFRRIEKSDPDKRKYVYCISHSVWNDGYNHSDRDLFTHNKRDVIPSGIHWIQIRDGNRLLAHSGGVGRISTPEQWKLFEWLRDSGDANLQWIFSRLEAELRGDISDSCMTYFLLTGDEDADLVKLKQLLVDKIIPQPIGARESIRIEAENFQILENYDIDFANDRNVSHRLCIQRGKDDIGRIKTPFNQPYTADKGRYDVSIRYYDEKQGQSQFSFYIHGIQNGKSWNAANDNDQWITYTISDVTIRSGDEIMVEVQCNMGEKAKLDYVEIVLKSSTDSLP